MQLPPRGEAWRRVEWEASIERSFVPTSRAEGSCDYLCVVY